jgi:hypothetical protein
MKYQAQDRGIAVAQSGAEVSCALPLSPYPVTGFSGVPATGSGAIPIISQLAGILNNRC